MTPSQQKFYNELIENNSKFENAGRGEPRNPYLDLEHLKTPAERYKNLVESPAYWAKHVKDLTVMK